MSILYFDCFSGISGDMTVGALIDIGVPQEYILNNLSLLNINDEYEIEIKKGVKSGIQGTDFIVKLKEDEEDQEHKEDFHHHHGRNPYDIEKIIDDSDLNQNIKNISKDIFKCIAEAEAKVHGKDVYDVHFHEVGAVDSIIDIVGTAICIDYLKPKKIICSPVNTGKGFVNCQHGIIPVPAPAVAEILRGVPVYCDEREFELTTPTGAAIVKTLSSEFRELNKITIKKVGYGCGKRDSEKPNLLRVYMCENEEGECSLLETTIDDMNPEIYGYLMEKLFEAGAVDVYYSPVYMKKNRSGGVITVIAPEKYEKKIKEIIFSETTTIGIRKIQIERDTLEREESTIYTAYGSIRCKFAKRNGKICNISPEYDDIKDCAVRYNKPLKEIYNYAIAEIMKNYLHSHS